MEKVEEILQQKEEKELHLTRLERRQKALKNFLEQNFESGRYFSIEEICKGVKDKDGYWYVLNNDPYVHDKCIKLSNDVRAINWNFVDGYKIIIKDKKGGCKLVENKEEFDAWWKEEYEKVEKKYQYLNNLKAKVDREGIVPIINQRGRVLDIDEMKPVEVFKHDEKQ